MSWKVLKVDGSSNENAMELLKQAIRGNVYCAVGFYETFHQVMQYSEEVEDVEDRTMEQGIDYCHLDEMRNLAGTIWGSIMESLNGKDSNDGDEDINTVTMILMMKNKPHV